VESCQFEDKEGDVRINYNGFKGIDCDDGSLTHLLQRSVLWSYCRGRN
jgi:hypothetical protein